MRFAGPTQTARTRLAGAHRLCGVPCNAGREHRHFLLQLGRAAMRAVSSLPVGGAHEDFAVPVAFVAMKFVDRHGPKVAGSGKTSSPGSLLEPDWAFPQVVGNGARRLRRFDVARPPALKP